MRSAFERPEVVASYEDWFRTAYGRMVEQIEVDLILEQLAPIAGGATVLDIGCGTGWFGARMAQHGFAVAGVDPSCPMLARGQVALPRGLRRRDEAAVRRRRVRRRLPDRGPGLRA